MTDTHIGSESAMPMKDMFPGVDPDRVKKLLNTEAFIAHEALGNLYGDLTARNAKGDDVATLLADLEKFYTPAIKALQGVIHDAGYDSNEMSAAILAIGGRISIG